MNKVEKRKSSKSVKALDVFLVSTFAIIDVLTAYGFLY